MKNIVIIGAGNVGAHVASQSLARGIKANFILVDQHQDFEQAQYLDLRDMIPIMNISSVQTADITDDIVREADIIVITAGAKQGHHQKRPDLIQENRVIFQKLAKSIGNLKSTCLLILISNPVDTLTYICNELFGLPKNQVFGTGTWLDTLRLHWHLQDILPDYDSSGLVMGEHGDSQFVAWSQVKNAEKLSEEIREKIAYDVSHEAYEIIKGKGSTYFGIGAATAELLRVIILGTKKIFPLSVNLQGEYGLNDIALGIPAILSDKGIEKVIELDLTEIETQKLQESAKKIRENLMK